MFYGYQPVFNFDRAYFYAIILVLFILLVVLGALVLK